MKITGLQPNTRYYYNYGDLVSIPDLMHLPCSQGAIDLRGNAMRAFHRTLYRLHSLAPCPQRSEGWQTWSDGVLMLDCTGACRRWEWALSCLF